MVNKTGFICAVYGCSNKLNQVGVRYSFYRFPMNSELCKQWIRKCKRADLEKVFSEHGAARLYSNYRVCSAHFPEKDMKDKNLPSSGLRKTVIPSLKLSTTETKRSIPRPKKIHTQLDSSFPNLSNQLPQLHPFFIDNVEDVNTEVKKNQKMLETIKKRHYVKLKPRISNLPQQYLI